MRDIMATCRNMLLSECVNGNEQNPYSEAMRHGGRVGKIINTVIALGNHSTYRSSSLHRCPWLVEIAGGGNDGVWLLTAQ